MLARVPKSLWSRSKGFYVLADSEDGTKAKAHVQIYYPDDHPKFAKYFIMCDQGYVDRMGGDPCRLLLQTRKNADEEYAGDCFECKNPPKPIKNLMQFAEDLMNNIGQELANAPRTISYDPEATPDLADRAFAAAQKDDQDL